MCTPIGSSGDLERALVDVEACGEHFHLALNSGHVVGLRRAGRSARCPSGFAVRRGSSDEIATVLNLS